MTRKAERKEEGTKGRKKKEKEERREQREISDLLKKTRNFHCTEVSRQCRLVILEKVGRG
jgi:hypothetical protein